MDTNSFDPNQPAEDGELHEPKPTRPRVRKGAIPRGGRPKKKSPNLQEGAKKRLAALTSARSQAGTTAVVAESVVARVLIDADQLDAEAEVTRNCWVQYRSWSPLQRTERFSHDYVAVYRELEAKRTGRPADKGRPLEPHLMLESPDVISALSAARAHADILGLPYPVFIRTVMLQAIGNGKWGGLPRPNQLYGKLAVPLFRGRTRIQNGTDALDQLADDPRYKAVNFRGDPDQVEVLFIICEMIRAAERPAEALALFMGTLGMLTPTAVLDLFPTGMVADAVALATSNTYTPSEVPPYRPGCFGYRARTAENVCTHCPMASACSQASDAARAVLEAKFKTDRPKDYHAKRGTADRSKRYRQRKKEAKAKAEAERFAKLEGIDRVREIVRRGQVKAQAILRANRKDRPFSDEDDEAQE